MGSSERRAGTGLAISATTRLAGAGAGVPSSPRPERIRGASEVDRLLGVWTLRNQIHLVIVADVQAHQAGDAFGVRPAVAALKPDIRRVFFGQVGQHRGRAGVEAGRIGDQQGIRSDQRARRLRGGLSTLAGQLDLQDRRPVPAATDPVCRA